MAFRPPMLCTRGQRTICSKSYAKRDQWAVLLARRLVWPPLAAVVVSHSTAPGVFRHAAPHSRTYWGHRGLFPKEHCKQKVARYQTIAQTTVWATVRPQTERSRDFCCSTRLSNGLGWQQDHATALGVLLREDSTMTPVFGCFVGSPDRNIVAS